MMSVPASVWRSHHTGAWASIAYALGISVLQVLRQEVQHHFHVGGITELRTTVAGAFEEGQRGFIRTRGLQRIVEQLPLQRRHIAVCGAVLDQERRRLGGNVSDRIDKLDLVGHGLDRRTDNQRLGGVGGIMGRGA